MFDIHETVCPVLSVEDGLTITFLNFEIIGDSNLHTSFSAASKSGPTHSLSLSLVLCMLAFRP